MVARTNNDTDGSRVKEMFSYKLRDVVGKNVYVWMTDECVGEFKRTPITRHRCFASREPFSKMFGNKTIKIPWKSFQ